MRFTTTYDGRLEPPLSACVRSRGYEELVERLAVRAREALGPEAELELDPPDGGVIGRVDNRLVDHTLPALVERCLAEHAVELERLWA